MDDVTRVLTSVGPVTSFPTVDAMHDFTASLAHRHPDTVGSRVIGRSRGGEPITALTIGSGTFDIVVVGNPHPNEPIGLATVRHLGELLATDHDLRDRIGATWHLVPVVDPDGARLNEGWFDGPRTRDDVARNFYRPPIEEQVEWTFPARWRDREFGDPIPETRALMALIDETRPALIASLHNGDFGGGYFYLGEANHAADAPEYWATLTGLLGEVGIPLHQGEPDAPGARELAPAVFVLPAITAMLDIVEASGADPAAMMGGGSTADYSARYGTKVLVSELPLWQDARMEDGSPSGRTLGEVLRAGAAGLAETRDVLRGVLERLDGKLTGPSPFRTAVERFPRALELSVRGKLATAVADGADRSATVAEAFMEEQVWPDTLRLRAGGMLLRLLDAESADPAVAAERTRFAPVFDDWCAAIRKDAPGHLIPIADLVGVQAAAVVATAVRIRDGLPV